jgi:hypothetical protein
MKDVEETGHDNWVIKDASRVGHVCCGSADGMLAERKLQPKTARCGGSEMEVKVKGSRQK